MEPLRLWGLVGYGGGVGLVDYRVRWGVGAPCLQETFPLFNVAEVVGGGV